MSRLRKVLAERAVASMQQTAQLTTVIEVDVTRLAVLRDRVKADFAAKTGDKLSFLPFFALDGLWPRMALMTGRTPSSRTRSTASTAAPLRTTMANHGVS